MHLFGIPEQLDIQMIFTENGMDAAGAVKGTLGSAQVEIVYSKISGSHIPSLIEGEGGRLLIRDLRNFKGSDLFQTVPVWKNRWFLFPKRPAAQGTGPLHWPL